MSNQKPPELHLIDGTVPKRGMPVQLPASIRRRIPKAEWLGNPDAWDREKFIEETADFLYTVYGIGNDQDKHLLSVLADHLETYINATRSIRRNTLVINYNNGTTPGPNPMLSIRNKTTTLIIQLMNELGLTPRGRLAANKADDESPLARLMKGPKG